MLQFVHRETCFTTLHSKGLEKSVSELPAFWGDCFVNICKSSKDNKLRQFTFKVVYRIITKKKELLKCKLADDKCPFCFNPDSIRHTFLYCQESKEFFSKTLRRYLMNIIKRTCNFQTSKFYLTRSMTPFQCKCQIQLKANLVYWFYCKFNTCILARAL